MDFVVTVNRLFVTNQRRFAWDEETSWGCRSDLPHKFVPLKPKRCLPGHPCMVAPKGNLGHSPFSRSVDRRDVIIGRYIGASILRVGFVMTCDLRSIQIKR